jgi:hypothetical protein
VCPWQKSFFVLIFKDSPQRKELSVISVSSVDKKDFSVDPRQHSSAAEDLSGKTDKKKSEKMSNLALALNRSLNF